MGTYSGDTTDSLRHSSGPLSEEAINEMVKSLLNELPEDCVKVGQAPFSKLNLPPDVSL